jgi:pyruvate dehydrogenase E1 component alpha subunit
MAAGVCAALNRDDYILSNHRGLGHFIAKGGNINTLMAEFMEKMTGCNKGKGGSMHMVDPSVGMLGANGIVGASIPIACGAALSAKLRGSRQVAVSFLGDGAANNGLCHESMNLAAVWKLPLVFVCENNLYQARVPSSRCSSIQDLYLRAAGYGFPGYKVDGMDVIAVYEAAQEAAERARQGGGPTLLEGKTYYFRGHNEVDPNRGLTYRSAQELESWEEKCPLRRARTVLLQKGWGTEAELKEIDDRCRQAVEEAVSFAVNSPKAPAEWAWLDVVHREGG